MSSAQAVLEVFDVHKTFGEKGRKVNALRGASLSVRKKEFVAIMGPSGCGKSTLLHLIAGLTRPDTGRIMLEQKEISTMSNRTAALMRREKIGFVFQDFNLIPTLTALENVNLGHILGGKVCEKSNTILQQLGIDHLKDQWPTYLSGGECQRIAIARALATDAAVILADEPTGSLDFENGQALCKLLREIQADKDSAIVLVTHETSVAQWADRVLIMKDGTIVREIKREDFSNSSELFELYRQSLGLLKQEGVA